MTDATLTLDSLVVIALVDIPAIQLDHNESMSGVVATASVGSPDASTTHAYVSLVAREVLDVPTPAAAVTLTNREVLRNADPHAQITQTTRETFRNANPEGRIVQFQREVLRKLTHAIFKGVQVDLAELWFAPGQFIDFSDAANRAKFHDANGHPVPLGTDGSLPTGTKPLLYMTLQNNDLTAIDFLTDQTGDGAMTLVTPGGKGEGYGLTGSPSD